MNDYYDPNGNMSQDDIFGKPIDRSRNRQEQERFQQPVIDPELQERLKNVPAPSKKTQKMIGLIALVVVVLIVVFTFLGSLFGPKRVAKKYFEAVLDGEWKAVYRQMELPDGALMSKGHFLDVHQGGKVDVTNLRLKETKDTLENDDFDGEFMRQYTAFYTVKGEDNPSQMTVQLIKQKEKSFLFFPKWRVSSGSMLVKNYPISAPAGYEIAIDGEKIKPVEEAQLQSGGYDTYLENIFVGNHTIAVAAKNRESAEFTFTVNEYDTEYYEVGQLDVSQKAVSDMQDIVQKFMGKVYGEALGKSGPSQEYMNYWAQTGQSLEESKYIKEQANEVYSRLESNLQNTYYDKIQFTSMNFSNYQSQVEENFSDEAGNFYVRIYVTYDFDYTYTGTETSYNGITTKENHEEAGTDDVEATFKLEDNEWKLTSINLYSVY